MCDTAEAAPVNTLAAWTLAEWAGFDAVHEHLVHHTLDAQGLHWLDTRSAPDAATERLLQQALSQAEAPPDALIARLGCAGPAAQPLVGLGP